MFGLEFSAAFLGLAAAACWGLGDFSGGFLTKRNPVMAVLIISQTTGCFVLVVAGLAMHEPFPPVQDLLIGMVAGCIGTLGAIIFYRGLADGHMGVVAPVTAVVMTIIPVIVAIFTEGLPEDPQLVGFALAFAAVWVISRGDAESPFDLRDIRAASISGLAFGLFFIMVDHMSEVSAMWPLLAARMASIPMLLVLLLRQQKRFPAVNSLRLILLTGVLDTGGNALFALATQAGRLDIATVLSSLYPAGTVFLAWMILKERISFRQWMGVAAAMVAVVLISV
jgi:drug/metabolite transporter (DMT)-like permease